MIFRVNGFLYNHRLNNIILQGLRRGLLVDFGFAILDSLDEDLEGNVLSSSGGRAALNTIPAALVRWNEESR